MIKVPVTSGPSGPPGVSGPSGPCCSGPSGPSGNSGKLVQSVSSIVTTPTPVIIAATIVNTVAITPTNVANKLRYTAYLAFDVASPATAIANIQVLDSALGLINIGIKGYPTPAGSIPDTMSLKWEVPAALLGLHTVNLQILAGFGLINTVNRSVLIIDEISP